MVCFPSKCGAMKSTCRVTKDYSADAAGAGGGAVVGAEGVLAAGGHAQAVCFAGGSLAGAAQAHSDPAAAGVLHQGAGGVSGGGGGFIEPCFVNRFTFPNFF